ncbi:MAG: ABC transporter substrate-binding protein [Planctomycetaceae bacterium]
MAPASDITTVETADRRWTEADELAFRDAYQQRLDSGTLKVGRFPLRSDGPKTFDPVRGSSVYENRCISQVYEPLLQYKYLVRPFELEPLLLQEMPQTDDNITYRFTLKKGIRFQDDPCFPDGIGRELIASDVFYSWKRIADRNTESKSWWLMENTILGFDEYRDIQNEADRFDYNAPVTGMRIIDDHHFEVELIRPVSRFLWTLAMFQTAIVPREAVEFYGEKFVRHPVGTGPYLMKDGDWKVGVSITYRRNPNYHQCFYPLEHMPEDVAAGRTQAAGRRLPFLDEIHVIFFVQDQPGWLVFRSGGLDYSQVPAENYPEAFNPRTHELRRSMKDSGITGYKVRLLDFIFKGFNMDDELLGGYTPQKKALRQAICLAQDWDEVNQSFYNGLNVVYDGPIPPGMAGHPPNGAAPVSFRGPDLERVRELLEEAGYPNGRGLPVIDYYVARGRNYAEQTEMLKKQLSRVNIRIREHLVDFSTLMQTVDRKQAPFFSFAWGSDYPDAENNLALFYGPYESPGSNHFNYQNPDYDRLYEQILSMSPSEERTEICRRMRDMVLEDCPCAGSMARTRFYVVRPHLKNMKPVEVFDNWYKYLDIDESLR